jgi:hypothetical protein
MDLLLAAIRVLRIYILFDFQESRPEFLGYTFLNVGPQPLRALHNQGTSPAGALGRELLQFNADRLKAGFLVQDLFLESSRHRPAFVRVAPCIFLVACALRS